MAKFKVSRATAKGKSWKAVGINPVTGIKMAMQGDRQELPLVKTIHPVKFLSTQDMMPPE